MLSEYEKINNREQRIMKNYHTSPATWANFLAAAGKFYEEVTSNQSLIANQNPKATVLKTVEEWNQKYCCYLKPEAKPIKLLMYENGQGFVKSVYDQKDICKGVDSIEIPKPWVIKEEHKEPVLAMLEKEVGPTDPNKSFDGRIMQIADIIVNCNSKELIDRTCRAGFSRKIQTVQFPYLRDIEPAIKDTFTNSLSYLLLSRCGTSMREWHKERNFHYLYAFDELPLMSWTACTISGLGKQVLLGIENTIQEYDQQQTKETQPIKNSFNVNMPKKKTTEKREHEEINPPAAKIRTISKIEKVAESPMEKHYIRKKVDANKQKLAETPFYNKPMTKNESIL